MLYTSSTKGFHECLRYSDHFLSTKVNLNWLSKYHNKAVIANISKMMKHGMDTMYYPMHLEQLHCKFDVNCRRYRCVKMAAVLDDLTTHDF